MVWVEHIREYIMNVKDVQPGNGYRIPAEAYFDEDHFQREQECLFPAVWNFIGMAAALADKGAYMTIRIGRYPILVIRGSDGILRGFHNICRHRGAQILDGEGACTKVICPYHRWQYSLEGELENVPQGDTQIPLLDKSQWGLMEVPTAEWMGMVFVNPNAKAGPLDSWLGQLADYLTNYDFENLAELAHEEYIFEANWKLYIENHVDWYHLWYVHAKTLSGLDHPAGYSHQLGAHWVSFEPYKDPANQVAPFQPIPWLNDENRLNGAHLMFPNLALFSGASWFGIGNLTPIAPDRTEMSFRLLALPDQDPSDFLAGFHQVTQVEDAGVAKRIQATVSSPAFNVGPLTNDHELAITNFHDAYLQYLQR